MSHRRPSIIFIGAIFLYLYNGRVEGAEEKCGGKVEENILLRKKDIAVNLPSQD